MPTLYQFVSRRSIQPTAESIANSKAVASDDEFLTLAKKAGEFEFTETGKDAEMIKRIFAKADSVSYWSEKTANGITVVRGDAVINGGKYPFRVFGVKGEAVPETTLNKTQLKTAKWGVCFQDGVLVDEMKTTANGCRTYPVAYLKIR